MKTTFYRIGRIFVIIIVFYINSLGAAIGQGPVDYVNPNIGSIGHLLTATTPDVQLPRGMIRLIPTTTPGIRDVYLADKIYSFSTFSLSNDFSKGIGAFSIMATAGKVNINSNENSSWFDHDAEKATPYYYSVLLEDTKIEVEYTVTQHSSIYRFTFPESAGSNLLIRLLQNSELKILNDNAIEGSQSYPAGNPQRRMYFHSEISKSTTQFGTWKGEEICAGEKIQTGNNIGFYTTYTTKKGDQVLLKTGFSYISCQQAKENLGKEIADWDFEKVKSSGRKIWNDALNKVQIQDGTDSQKATFYTALYRVYGRKTTDITEYGRYYSGFDHKVHDTEGHNFYQLGESWGSFRSLFPLGLLLEPERQNDFVRSYLRMYDQTGWLGDAALGDRVMTGWHETASITDAYNKGFRDYDVEKAYAAMKKNLTEATKIRHCL